jgi:hypothetical protein
MDTQRCRCQANRIHTRPRARYHCKSAVIRQAGCLGSSTAPPVLNVCYEVRRSTPIPRTFVYFERVCVCRFQASQSISVADNDLSA